MAQQQLAWGLNTYGSKLPGLEAKTVDRSLSVLDNKLQELRATDTCETAPILSNGSKLRI